MFFSLFLGVTSKRGRWNVGVKGGDAGIEDVRKGANRPP